MCKFAHENNKKGWIFAGTFSGNNGISRLNVGVSLYEYCEAFQRDYFTMRM